MPHGIAMRFGEADISEDELNQPEILFIKFHMRDLIDDATADYGDDEQFLIQGLPQTIESLSIPRQHISNKTEILLKVSEVLNRLNVPSHIVPDYAEGIYSKVSAASESDSGETIRPILVNIIFITFIFPDDDDEDTGELTRGVGNLSVSSRTPATETSIEALEEVVEGLESEGNCAICLEELVLTDSKVLRMPCLHLFHGNCIVKWLKKSHLCPMCRFEMPVQHRLSES